MDDLLFTIIAVSATSGFVLGVLSGVWPVLLTSSVVMLLLLWLARSLRL